MARSKGRTGAPFRRAQAQCFAEETHCCFCHNYVDQSLANYRSRYARSVHHLIPPDVAPDLAAKRENMRLAHIGCNSSYGRGNYPDSRRRQGPRTPGRTKRHRYGWSMGRARVAVPTSDRDW